MAGLQEALQALALERDAQLAQLAYERDAALQQLAWERDYQLAQMAQVRAGPRCAPPCTHSLRPLPLPSTLLRAILHALQHI